MGVAYSDIPPIHTVGIDGETAVALRAGIHAMMVAAGIDFEAVENGYLYELLSDQSLRCRVLIKDAGLQVDGKSELTVQFQSVDGERLGVEHPLIYDTDRSYEITVSRAQLFIALTGYSSDEASNGHWGQAVCGGVPFIPDLPLVCLDEGVQESEEVTEAWWSSGSGDNELAAPYGFRASWVNRWKWDGCWNGDLVGGYNQPEPSILRLAVLAHPLPDFGSGIPVAQQTIWVNGEPLYVDPFLIWGDAPGSIGRLRGQIWDAMLATADCPLDDEIETQEYAPITGIPYGDFHWRNWMQFQGGAEHGSPGSYYSALYLLTNITDLQNAGESNYAY